MTEKNLREYLLPYMVNAAIRAGAAVMDVYNSKDGCDISLKSDLSPITNADRAAHNAIKETLGPTRIPILSEEGREMLYEERENWDLFWLVDPLDGTVEFINRNNEFTINIALMNHNNIVAGVIYIPCLNKLYFAGEGYGAHLRNDLPPNWESNLDYAQISELSITLPQQGESRKQQIVVISRSHITAETHTYIDKLRLTHPDLDVRIQGSSYKFCLLAEGSMDYYVRTSHTYEWDTAAGEIILSEAGGSTTSLETNAPLKYNKRELQNPWFQCNSPISRIELE